MHRRRFILLTFIGLISFGSLVFAQQDTRVIKLKLVNETVVIRDSIVHLEQIAKIECDWVGVANRIGSIDIDEFSGTDPELVISRDQLGIRLRLAGFRPSDFEITGPKSIKVVRASYRSETPPLTLKSSPENLAAPRSIDPRPTLEAKIRRNILNEYSIAASDLHVVVDPKLNLPKDLGDLESIVVLPVGRTDLPLGNQTFSATVDTHSKSQVSLKIRASVSVYREFAVANRDIQAGTTFTSENLDSVRRPVSTRSTSNSFLTYSNAVGKSATKDLEKYSLLKPASVSRIKVSDEVLVKRNSLIEVTFQQGMLTVGFKDVKALTEGALGDRVEFIHPRTNKRATARVLSAHSASIE